MLAGIACIPVYVSNSPAEATQPDVNCSDNISVQYDIEWSSDDGIREASFIVNSVLCNFIPCCLLAGLTLGLLASLRQQRHRRDELLSTSFRGKKRSANAAFAIVLLD
jgi:hypothetical protein